jgi:hypothetical protein
MAVRFPGQIATDDPLGAAFAYEAAAEIAVSLGHAGKKAEASLVALAEIARDDPRREALLRQAARDVHAWFIQREIAGMRRHGGIIRDLSIPNEVLARLGAS